jgi:hypothetical protein
LVPIHASGDDIHKEIYRKSIPDSKEKFLKKQDPTPYKVTNPKKNHENYKTESMINNRSGVSKVARTDLYNKGVV